MSDHVEYIPAPKSQSVTNTVTIPLSYFQLLVEHYYGGRREAEVQQPAPQPEQPAQFVQKNWNGIDLLEDMPPGWKRVNARKA